MKTFNEIKNLFCEGMSIYDTLETLSKNEINHSVYNYSSLYIVILSVEGVITIKIDKNKNVVEYIQLTENE